MVATPGKVLAATDLTAAGDATVAWACAVVAKGASVRFVHVLDEELYPSPLYAHYSPGVVPTPEKRAAQIAELEARLRAMIPPDAAARGIRVEVEILEGDVVADVLTARAESMGADLVVLGTRRRSALAKALLGSVESAVLGMSGRPVLLVPA